MLICGWLWYAACYVCFRLARAPWQMWTLFAAYGLVAALTEGTERALIAAASPPRSRGRALGLYNLVSGVGLLAASVVGGTGLGTGLAGRRASARRGAGLRRRSGAGRGQAGARSLAAPRCACAQLSNHEGENGPRRPARLHGARRKPGRWSRAAPARRPSNTFTARVKSSRRWSGRSKACGEGEQAAFSIPAEDAYGERKDDNVVSLPKTLFPDDVKLEQGLCLYARASGGQSYPITVREVKEDMVVVDLNHPLAGERLFFEVNIRGVRPAGNQEIFAGKAASMEVV